MVSDLDFTNCKALLAELIRILLADGGGFKLDFLMREKRGFKANTLVIYIHFYSKAFRHIIWKKITKFY